MSQRKCVSWVTVAVLFMLTSGASWATDATVSGDASVNSAHPAVNYGRLSNLLVGGGGTTLIQFDLSSLPAGTTASQIGKATLKLYINRIDASGSVSVLPVSSAWTESAVTYNTIPSLGTAIATFTPTLDEQYAVVDITSLVQSWVTTPASNDGIALTSAAGVVLFDSKENDETSHAAHLDITVISQGPVGPMGPQGPIGLTGAQGPGGPAGAVGATGLQGPQGPVGPAGPQGLIGPTGVQGSTGVAGASGATGATGAQGPPVSFRGTWSSSTVYAIGDAVSESGTSYIALLANFTVDPAADVASSGGVWAVLAKQGSTGASGPAGATGATGPAGPAGPTGPTGPVGPQGPAGSTANFRWVANISNPLDSLTYYVPPVGAIPGGPNSASEGVPGAGDLYVPASCTVTGLLVRSMEVNSGFLGTDISTFTVRHNGASTAMTCTVNNSSAVLGATATCTDTTHTFAVTAGDLIEFQYSQTNGTPALNYSTMIVCQ